uniref:synaptotagmin-4-like n=1 Tax=Myxine glutinosa TaxID=7769 RepID=UPI00358F3626
MVFVAVTLLIATASASVFTWICCQRRAGRSAEPRMGKLIHIFRSLSVFSDEAKRRKCCQGYCESEHQREAVTVNQPTLSPGIELSKPCQLTLVSPDGNQNTIRSWPDIEPSCSHRGDQETPVVRTGSAASPESSAESYSGSSTREGSLCASKSPSPGSWPDTNSPEMNLGTLLFAAEYDFHKQAFVVTIQEARGLPIMDEQTSSSDPYVKMTILPEKKHKVKTRVMRKTLDPAFDETFTFYGILFNQLQDLALHFLVFSFDRYSRDDVVGEVLVPLAGIDLGVDKVFLSRDITKRNVQKSVGRGELLVSLCLYPTASRLTVVVLKARHLPKTDIAGLSDPYVKINIYCGKHRVAKKKTHVKRRTLNPVFNESYAVELPAEGFSDVSVEFLVVDFDRTTKDEVIGRLVLGTDCEHWRELCQHPRRQVAKWHPLTEC